MTDRSSLSSRAANFLHKTWRQKAATIGFHWVKTFPWLPFPVRLPYGGWWLASDDPVGHGILSEDFETAEWRFVAVFLQPGMTVLDVGAHHGFYSVLASKRVGPTGQVIAFEPSQRERDKLRRHLWLNSCKNVRLERFALGAEAGEADLFVVEGHENGCNSLRPPNGAGQVTKTRIPMTSLDDYARRQNFKGVDFVKMDVEGAELQVLRGAVGLLQTSRPVILCELQRLRVEPWGHTTEDVARFLVDWDFILFKLRIDGSLERVLVETESFDANYVAVPRERLDQIAHVLETKQF